MPRDLMKGRPSSWEEIAEMQIIGQTLEVTSIGSEDQWSLPHSFVRGHICEVLYQRKIVSHVFLRDVVVRSAPEGNILTEWVPAENISIDFALNVPHKPGFMSPWVGEGGVLWFRMHDTREVIIYPPGHPVGEKPFLYRNADELKAFKSTHYARLEEMVRHVNGGPRWN
jgi:hypothetical protein